MKWFPSQIESLHIDAQKVNQSWQFRADNIFRLSITYLNKQLQNPEQHTSILCFP